MPQLYNLKSQHKAMAASVAENLIEWTAGGHHTTGDVRLLYMTLDLRGVGGSGEALRPRTRVYGTSVNSAHGEHCTLHIAAGGEVSGLGAGLRATLEAAAATRTLTGTLCALQVDSNIATGNTLPASHAFMRFADNGAVAVGNLFQIPDADDGTIFAVHTTQTMSHSIKIISADGTAYYIMCTDTATNRS